MKHVLEVAGMNCGGCEGLIGDELGALDGVLAVAASAADGVVEVDIDESKVEVEQVLGLIAELGFSPTI